MNTIDIDNCLFLIIDMQDKLVNMLNDKSVKEQAVICAKAAGILKVPAIITEQYPKGLGGTIEEIKTALPNAQYLEKTYFSAYKDKTIKEAVDKYSKKQIIMFGIETHICVLQTAFDLINAGYELFIIENSCGSRSEDNKNTALKRLLHNNAQIISTEMAIFELLKTSRHANFKELQNLIK